MESKSTTGNLTGTVAQRHHFRQDLKDEIAFLSKFFGRRMNNKFLAVNFEPVMAEIVYVESSASGLRLLAHRTGRVVAAEPKTREEGLVEFIKDFLQQNAVTTKDALVSISDFDSVFFKDIVLPAMPEAEILEAAKWQLKDDVPYDLEQCSIDWQVLEEVTGEEGQKGRRTMFIAANNEAIRRYLSVVQECRLEPLSVTTSAFNYAHILENLPDAPSVAAVLNIGQTETTFGIYVEHKLNFVRRLPVSWEKFMHSLTKVLVSDGGSTQLTYEQAEEITRNIGIPQQDAIMPDNIQQVHVLSLMRPFLETLTREIKFSLDYFTANFGKEKPAVLYLTGEGPHLKNLDGYLRAAFEIEAVSLPLPARVDTRALGADAPGLEEQSRIMNVLGAALGGPTRLSLLPVEIKNRRLEFLGKAFLRFVAIIFGVVLVFSLFVMQFQVGNYETRIKNARLHVQTMADVQTLAQEVRARQDLMQKIEAGKVPLEGILKVVSTAIPEQIVLEALTFDSPAHQLTLRGYVAASREATETILAGFMQQLEASAFFAEARFVSSQKTGTAYAFEIECDIVR